MGRKCESRDTLDEYWQLSEATVMKGSVADGSRHSHPQLLHLREERAD